MHASDSSRDASSGNESREPSVDSPTQREQPASLWQNPVRFAQEALTHDSEAHDALETDGMKLKTQEAPAQKQQDASDEEADGASDAPSPTDDSNKRFSAQGFMSHFRPARLLKATPSMKGTGWYKGDPKHKHTSIWKDEAPRYVTYGDSYLAKNSYGVPDPKLVKGFQYFNISFFLANGPSDNVKEWSKATMDCKEDIVKKYNKEGIRLGMSLGGADDKPITNKVDPEDIAKKAADFVIRNALQGVDIDFEEFQYFEKGNKKGADFVIALTKGLRKRLPAERYYISHAPVAPLFNPKVYKYGYTYVEQQVGHMINFYNIQFYNQDKDYQSKETLVYKSKKNPGTAVLQLINEQKIPAGKVVVGKPLRPKDATDGYVDAHDLARWLQHAANHGWTGGVMWYEYRKAIEKSLEAVTREVHYGKD